MSDFNLWTQDWNFNLGQEKKLRPLFKILTKKRTGADVCQAELNPFLKRLNWAQRLQSRQSFLSSFLLTVLMGTWIDGNQGLTWGVRAKRRDGHKSSSWDRHKSANNVTTAHQPRFRQRFAFFALGHLMTKNYCLLTGSKNYYFRSNERGC